MIDLIHQLLPVLDHFAHYSSDDSDNNNPIWLLAAGPVAAVAIYTTLFRYYRNTDKRNQYEKETATKLLDPITGTDQKVGQVRGVRNSRVQGDNVADYRQRVKRIPVDPQPRQRQPPQPPQAPPPRP